MKKQMKSVMICFLALIMLISAIPVTSDAASKKTTVVTNQKQLEQAVRTGKKDIQIKTAKGGKLTIPASKKVSGATITINAKSASIINKASVKNITIKDAKSYTESGKNNVINVADKKLSFIVAKNSKGTTIKTIAKSDLSLSGSIKNPVKIIVGAKGTTVKTSVAVDATLKANATIQLAKGAEKSKLTTAKGVKADVVNHTKSTVTLKDSSGIAMDVPSGKTSSYTDQFPKVDFSKSDDVLTGKVSFERNKLLLTVDFMSDEVVFDEKGNKLKDWTADIGLHQPVSDQFCMDEDLKFSGANDENVTVVFEIFADTVGMHSFQFDYEVYEDEDETKFIGKKTFTVYYEVTQDDLSKLNASYVGKVYASGKDSIYADFSAANPSGTGWFAIKKQGSDEVTWVNSREIWDVEDKPYQYDIELEKELEDGTYIVMVSYPDSQNAQYLGKFTYDSSAWANLDTAREIVKSELENIDLLDSSNTADVLKSQLETKVKSGTGDDQIQLEVERWTGEEEDVVFVRVSIIRGGMMYIETCSDVG